MLKILLSNDDGVYAAGLNVLAEAMSSLGEVVIVAPDRNRSGASNSLTLDRPLRVKEISDNTYSVEGTPTDCVHLALTGLLDDSPDIVISGINEGANLGDDILYSGTVAAATEGRFLGLPAIAVSLVEGQFNHYHTAADVAKRLVKHLKHEPLPANTILNVNVPDVTAQQLQGIEVTRLGARHIAEPAIKAQDPRGHDIYWIGPAGAKADAGMGTDFFAVQNNKVSITPLSFDVTDYKAFDKVAGWTEGVSKIMKNN
jgi:5'-nucleotidase